MSETAADGGSVHETLERISRLYGQSLREHGLSSRSVGWKDEASQLLRFEKLAQVVTPSDTPVTVNDWGCGYGAMFRYLDALPHVRLAKYVGYDINPAMLQQARRFTGGDSRVVLVQATEITETCDYGFVSGTFNVRLTASEDEWRRYVERMLHALARTSRLGFAFNLLTSYVEWRDPQLFYADPCHFFEFCKRQLSGRVSLLHDYPLYEWTIIVRVAEVR